MAAVDPAVPRAAVALRHLATPAVADVVPHQATRVAPADTAAVGENIRVKVAPRVTPATGVLRVAGGKLRLQSRARAAARGAAGAVKFLAVGAVAPDITVPGATRRLLARVEVGRLPPSVGEPACAVIERA